MKSSQKLMQRLRDELGLNIPEGTIIKTLHTGRHQKAGGALSWMLYHPNHAQMCNIGSTYTVAALLKYNQLTAAPNRSISTIEIDPDT